MITLLNREDASLGCHSLILDFVYAHKMAKMAKLAVFGCLEKYLFTLFCFELRKAQKSHCDEKFQRDRENAKICARICQNPSKNCLVICPLLHNFGGRYLLQNDLTYLKTIFFEQEFEKIAPIISINVLLLQKLFLLFQILFICM